MYLVKLICCSAFLLCIASQILGSYRVFYRYIRRNRRTVRPKMIAGMVLYCLIGFAFFCFVVSLFFKN